MATNTAGTGGQLYYTNMVHYISKTITFADDDLVVAFDAQLPPKARVIDCGAVVTTAFTAGSVVMDLGTSADPDCFASALVMTTAGCIRDVSTNPLIANDDSSDTTALTIVASLTSGSTITAGSAEAFVTYIVPRT